jgi:regulator of protease activity HflC (stomatin/prohibitin superfamily)
MDLGTVFNVASYAAAGIAGAAALYSTFYTVPQRKVGLITQFGKHVKTVEEPGLKVKIPFIQQVAAKVSTAELQAEETLQTKTTDDLFVDLPIAIHFQVSNAPIFFFDKGDPVKLMKKVVSAAVREYTSGKAFQELYNERQEIRDGVLEKVASKIEEFGITINDIVIDEPQASNEVKSTFDRVRASALEKEAAKNEAAAEYIRQVKSAEADKERDILRGQGAAGYRKEIFDQYAEQIESLVDAGTPREEAVHFMETIMKLDTWREVGTDGNMLIVTDGSSKEGNELVDLMKNMKGLQSLSPKNSGDTSISGVPTPGQ